MKIKKSRMVSMRLGNGNCHGVCDGNGNCPC